MQWLYNGISLNGDEDFIGQYKAFVYVIVNKSNNRRYFGKKRLHFTSHRRRKHRHNRIKIVKESDWQTYWGSSDKLKNDIEQLGTESFSREILRFCRTLSESSYYELKYQMENDVLLKPNEFYNEYVGGRISRRQMGVKDVS